MVALLAGVRTTLGGTGGLEKEHGPLWPRCPVKPGYQQGRLHPGGQARGGLDLPWQLG